MEAGWIYVVSPGLLFKVSLLNLYDGDIIGHELTVQLSPKDIKVWMHCNVQKGQNYIIIFLRFGGGVPLPALHFRLSPRHLHSLRIGATVLSLSTETGAHVGTATVGNESALLRLADVNTVGTRH